MIEKELTLSEKWIAANEESYMSKLVMDTARRAADLTKLSGVIENKIKEARNAQVREQGEVLAAALGQASLPDHGEK